MEEEIENLDVVSSTEIPDYGDEDNLEGANIEETEGAVADE